MVGPQLHPSRIDGAFGLEQQREIIEALRDGGTLTSQGNGLYELFVPGVKLRVTSQPDRYITVIRSTVRSLVAKGYLQFDQDRNLILTKKGREASLSIRKRMYT